MDSHETYWTDVALLQWQIELGATQAIGDVPVNRYEVREKAIKAPPLQAAPPLTPAVTAEEAVQELAIKAAHSAQSLSQLQSCLQNFQGCAERKGARQTVFASGAPSSKIMVVLDPPQKEEDQLGVPIAGQSAVLFAQMFLAIGLQTPSPESKDDLYLVASLPWRPAMEGPADPEYAQIMTPFLEAHIKLANPETLIIMGDTPLRMLTPKTSLRRAHGQWVEVLGRKAMPIYHPRTLQNTPSQKRDAWHDLLRFKRDFLDHNVDIN